MKKLTGNTQRVERLLDRMVSADCDRCQKPTKMTFNWCKGEDGSWYHECWECGNVMKTKHKIIDVDVRVSHGPLTMTLLEIKPNEN